MPKKTKREKLIAEARRIIQQSKQPVPTPVSPPGDIPVHLPTNKPNPSVYAWDSHNPNSTVKGLNDEAEYAQIKKNLTKTVILAAIAVFIEFVFYWRLG